MTTPTPTPLNTKNIQGDIIIGLQKRVEAFIFFQIAVVPSFRSNLKKLVPSITTTEQVLNNEAAIGQHKSSVNKGHGQTVLIKLECVNIGFSNFGLQKMGITNNVAGNDNNLFVNGQKADAAALGDVTTTSPDGKSVPVWDAAFLQPLDGVILITAHDSVTLDARIADVKSIFGQTITVVEIFKGNVRPGQEKGHEHFGFNDGLSQPGVQGFTTPNIGQKLIPSGFIVCGGDQDPLPTRDPVAKDGSIMCFRKLKQYVPEFDAFLLQNGTGFSGLTPQQGADFLGARFVGRWKSGAPIDLTPLRDNPEIAKDKDQNNNFDYSMANPPDITDQTRCPFSAHLRKMNPRNDLESAAPNSVDKRRISRAGIPYGPEVTDAEKHAKTTQKDRGLAFVCYQTSLPNQFHFLQTAWANNPNFKQAGVGFDPIIGANSAAGANRSRTVAGFDPKAQTKNLTIAKDFVESRGGEYFFMPSIAMLTSVIATA